MPNAMTHMRARKEERQFMRQRAKAEKLAKKRGSREQRREPGREGKVAQQAEKDAPGADQ